MGKWWNFIFVYILICIPLGLIVGRLMGFNEVAQYRADDVLPDEVEMKASSMTYREFEKWQARRELYRKARVIVTILIAGALMTSGIMYLYR